MLEVQKQLLVRREFYLVDPLLECCLTEFHRAAQKGKAMMSDGDLRGERGGCRIGPIWNVKKRLGFIQMETNTGSVSGERVMANPKGSRGSPCCTPQQLCKEHMSIKRLGWLE